MSEYVHKVTCPIKPLTARLGQLDLELTERCDNDCVHCCVNLPAGDVAARAREMTTEQVKDVLRQAAELGCLEVRFTGGEPLLRPDFEELYLCARRLGLRVLIFTNGRRITERLAGLLAQVPPLVRMEITVYGMHQESYEAVTRAPGSFAQFRRGVERLLSHGIPFVVKGALLPPNRDEVDEFERWAREIPAMDGPPRYSMFFDLRGRRDNLAKNELIESVRLAPEDGLRLVTRDQEAYRAKMTEFASRFMGARGDQLFPCGVGHGLCIDAYGCAQPCMGLRAPELTVSVLDSLLEDALDAFRALSDLRSTSPEYLRRCARCSLRGLCEQCPAKSWAEYGTLDTPVEYLCDVAHAQARHMGWLHDDENGWDFTDSQDRL